MDILMNDIDDGNLPLVQLKSLIDVLDSSGIEGANIER